MLKRIYRIFRLILTAFMIGFLLFWGGSCAYHEVLTLQHKKEFTELYKLSNMIDSADYLKVMEYSDNSAKIYYVSKGECGDLFTFAKNNGIWELEKWETIWSKYGSADGYIWPYFR